MEGIRIIKLPCSKMISSNNKDLGDFNNWWSKIDQKRKDKFFPRDFMSYDLEQKKLIWYYAISEDIRDIGGFDTTEFSGGLYAV